MKKYKLFLHETLDGRAHMYRYNTYDNNTFNEWSYGGYFLDINKALQHIGYHIRSDKYELKQDLLDDILVINNIITSIATGEFDILQGKSWTFCKSGVEFKDSDFPNGRISYLYPVTLTGIAKHMFPHLTCPVCNNIHIKSSDTGKLIYGNCKNDQNI